MIELLTGDDDFGAERYLREQRAALGPPDTASLNLAVFDGALVAPDAFAAAAHAVPFLGERRLVIVHRLVARLAGGGTNRKSAKAGDPWGPWVPLLLAVPEWTTVLLNEVGALEGDRRRPAPTLPAALAKAVQHREFATPRGDALVAWAAGWARDAGARLGAGVAAILVEAVGDDTRRLATEIDKLATYAGDRVITADDVARLVASSRDASVFELADAVLERDRFKALTLAHDLLDQGLSPQYLITMLARQFRLALTALDLNQRGAAAAEARRQAGLGSDFVYRKALAQSKRYTAQQLIRRIGLLCELDSAVKTGTVEEALGLDLLVAAARRGRAG